MFDLLTRVREYPMNEMSSSKSEKKSKIDLKKLEIYFDSDFRLVKEHEFRRAVFQDGVDEEARQVVWKFLFQFYPFRSTKRERDIIDLDKFVEYQVMKNRWNQIIKAGESSPQIDFGLKIETDCDRYRQFDDESKTCELEGSQQPNLDYVKLQTILKVSRLNVSPKSLLDDMKQIDKDINRTGYLIELDDDQSVSEREKCSIREALRNILVTFAAFNQSVVEVDRDQENGTPSSCSLGYTQGMNDLASVFVKVFRNEFEAYWCFSNYMLLETYSTSSIALNMDAIASTHVLKTNVAYYFSSTGMWKKLKHLSYLLSVTDPELYEKLEQHDMQTLPFCHEWLLLNFKRCFATTREFFECFEALNSHFIELHNSVLKGINVKSLYTFDLFVCLSLLKQARARFLAECHQETDFFEVFASLNQSKLLALNFEAIVLEAEKIFDQYCIISHTVCDFKEERLSTFQKLRSYLFF